MYPYPVFLGLNLYDICLLVAIFACFLIFSIYADRERIRIKHQRFAVICGIAAVILGYGSAVLFQAFYNIKSLGRFEINENTGATFYGGLIGGVVVFLVLYFGIGNVKFKDRSHFAAFFSIANCATPGIALAHSIGRIGCLMAGCCHGSVTTAWYGIKMWGNSGYTHYVPTQLFEAIFLMLLFGFLTFMVLSKRGYNLSSYLVLYGIWRFIIEYVRADYRGDTVISALTPSQFTAIILIAVGIAVIFVEKKCKKYFIAGDQTEGQQ